MMHDQLMTIRKQQGSHHWNCRTRSAVELLEAVGRSDQIPAAPKFDLRSLGQEVAIMKRMISALTLGSPTEDEHMAVVFPHGVEEQAPMLQEFHQRIADLEDRHRNETDHLRQKLAEQNDLITTLNERLSILEVRHSTQITSKV